MLQLYIENILVETSKEIEVPLNYVVTDLGNPQAIKNDYSKTVAIPGTPNNNKLFGHIYRADRINPLGTSMIGISFNANKRANYTLIDNGTIFSQGYAKLDNISVSNNIITYNLTLYGGIGNFFYGLMYGDTDNYLNLNSLYYGINGYNTADENRLQLFDYNKDFVVKCWNNRLNNDVDGNDMYKMFCPIPMYSGYYDDFDSDKILINKDSFPHAMGGNRSYVEVVDGETTTVYTDKSGWVLCNTPSELSEWEMRDIRSHYQHLGVRMRSIYDAIKNPINNNGYIVDDSNVNDIEKEYIDNMYVVLNKFNYEEIGQTSETIQLSDWSHDVSNSFNNTLTPSVSSRSTDLPDISEWASVGGKLVIIPEWSLTNNNILRKPATNECPFATTFVAGYNSKEAAWPWAANANDTKGLATIISCYQYYWVELADASNRVIAKTPAYMLGMNKSNYGVESLGSFRDVNTTLGQADLELRGMFESVISNRGHGNGEVVWSFSNNEWQFKNTVDGDPNNPIYDFKTLVPQQKESNDMGSSGTFTIDLNDIVTKNAKKITLYSSTISIIAAFNYIGYTVGQGLGVTASNILLNANTQNNQIYKFGVWRGMLNTAYNGGSWQNEGIPLRIGNALVFSRIPNDHREIYAISPAEGKASTQSQIYAGSASEEGHVLTKTNIFANTKTPYDYLVSLAKIFNWKMALDRYDKKVYIYSHNKFYTNKIYDISKQLDYSSYTINPNTSANCAYDFVLEHSDENYANKLYNTRYGADYGKFIFTTEYEFSKEHKDTLSDVIYTQGVPWLLSSVYFNDEDELHDRKITPFMGAKYFITLWDRASNESEELERKYNGLLFANKVSQNTQDKTLKLCNFNNEYSDLDLTDMIVMYDSRATDNQKAGKYYISDNIPVTSQLNDNNCYIKANDDVVTLDAISGRKGKAANYMAKIPVFGNRFYSNNMYYYSTYNVSSNYKEFDNKINNTNIFDLCWKNYFTDLYDRNTKVITIKYNLIKHPTEAMREFYTFDGALWCLNKITDYCPGYKRFTKCEFIKIKDLNNYLT